MTENRDSLPELLSRAQEDLRAADVLIDLDSRKRQAAVEEYAGAMLAPMLHSRRKTMALLLDENPELRKAAIMLLSYAWDEMFPSPSDLMAECENLVLDDPDPHVRGLAWNVLFGLPSRITHPLVKEAVLTLCKRDLQASEDLAGWKECVAKMRDEMRELDAEIELMHLERDAALQQIFLKGLGSQGREMLNSYEATVSGLDHSDPRIRTAAVRLISMKWGTARGGAKRWMEMFEAEKDVPLRQALAAVIVEAYEGTEDTDCCSLLASIVADGSASIGDRFLAYRGLYRVSGAASSRKHGRGSLCTARMVGFPENIDWSFVRSFMK